MILISFPEARDQNNKKKKEKRNLSPLDAKKTPEVELVRTTRDMYIYILSVV